MVQFHQVFYRTLWSGATNTLDLERPHGETRILEVKRQIADAEGLATHQLRLVHAGRELDDDAMVPGGHGRETKHGGVPSSVSSSSSSSCPPTLHLALRLRGGIDFQNREGIKFGGGGQASGSQETVNRRERLRKLAMETMDLANDPYLLRNHLGTYECKLCLTLHNNEGNYLAHTQGKRHQTNLARRAAKEAEDTPVRPEAAHRAAAIAVRRNVVKIGQSEVSLCPLPSVGRIATA
jgi:hypothetical protein